MTSRDVGRGDNAYWAQTYARSGWPVFPVRANDPGCADPDSCQCKAPLTAHGFQNATTDAGRVDRYWDRHPDANVGVATGAPGPVVLDVDSKDGKPGFASLNEAIRAGLVPSPMHTVRTPTGGAHLYYAATLGQRNGSLDRQGLDWRAEGGYVVAPPSTVHGRAYEIHSHGGQPATIDFDAIREHFRPLPPVRPPRETERTGHLAAYIDALPDGHGRHANDKTFWAMCRAFERNDPGAVDDIAAAAIRRGLSPAAVAATQRSAAHTIGASVGRPFQAEAG
jgi:hypothetical protein